MNRIGLAALAVATLCGIGCADITPPNLFHPGPAEYQRAQAERIDPYPETDVAPEIVGSRPRDFQKPKAEPLRVQNEYSWSRRYGTPPPGLFSQHNRGPVLSPVGFPNYASYTPAPVYPYAGGTPPGAWTPAGVYNAGPMVGYAPGGAPVAYGPPVGSRPMLLPETAAPTAVASQPQRAPVASPETAYPAATASQSLSQPGAAPSATIRR